MTNSIDYGAMGDAASANAFTGVTEWLDGFFEGFSGTYPDQIVTLIVGFIGTFAVLWACWYGFKALRKAFSKANF